MAVNFNDTKNQNNDAENNNTASASQTRQTTSARRAEGFGGAVRSVRRSFSRRATSEIVRAYKSAFDQIISQTESYGEGEGQFKFYSFPVDGDQHGLPISSLVFVREEQGFSAALILSLAATCGELADRYVKAGRDQYGNTKQIALPQTPSDIWEFSSNYRRILQEEVEARLGRSKYEVIGNIVLPAHVTAEDTEVLDSTIWRIVDNLENYLVSENKFDQISTPSLGMLKSTESLKSRLEFNQPQGIDSLGNVRRQDVNVRIISEESPKNNDEIDEAKTTEVGCVTGYVDAVYVGREPDTNAAFWRADNVQSYMPAFVITSLDSGQDAVTLESIGFNLAAVSVLARENRWVAAFRSQGSKNPLRHAGALGCQLPALDSPINGDGSFVPMGKVLNDAEYRYARFCQLAFEWDSLLFMLDIEESGEMSPMLAVIADIAISNDKGALDYWNKAMDYLTEGKYSKIWKAAGEPRIFEDMDLRIPLGAVRLEENSEKEFDLRTLDQVAIANLEDSNDRTSEEEIETYNEAFYGNTFSGEQRTEIICRYIRSRYAGLVKFTGYARRVRVTTALLDILAEAFEANAAAIEPDQNFEGFNQQRRGNPNLRRDGYSANDSGMFRRSSAQRASASRWGGMRQGWRN